jgi:RND family efflux transporter MFP subunit
MKKIGIVGLFLSILISCQPKGNPGNPGSGTSNADGNTDDVKGVKVEVKKIIPTEFNHYIEINGSVKAEKEAFVGSEIMGQIQKIHVNEGSRVSEGQLLITLSTSLIKSNIEEVQTNLDLARETFQKQKELWEQNIGTEMQYLQAKNNMESLEKRLETLNTQLDMLYIKAPFDGVVDELFVQQGELASVGRNLLHIVNLSKLKIYGDVSETYLPYVREGEMAELRFPVYPDYVLKTPIHRTGRVINEKSRTFTIEIKLDNKEGLLRPNMITQIKLNDFSASAALVVPSYIIKQDFTGWFLYLAEKNGASYVARKKYVKPGNTYQNETMILEGLSPDDEVIIVGYNLVSGGTEISILNRKV